MSAPDPLHKATIRPEWIDRNGHMNLAYYVMIFDQGTDALFDALGLGQAYSGASGNSMFVVETHILYERELRADALVAVRGRVLGADAKRLHFALEMRREGEDRRAAMQELMAVHVDMSARRAAPFPPDRRAAIAEMAAVQAGLDWPAGLGRRIALPQPPVASTPPPTPPARGGEGDVPLSSPPPLAGGGRGEGCGRDNALGARHYRAERK